MLQSGGSGNEERQGESAARASAGALEGQRGCTYTRVSPHHKRVQIIV